MADKDLARIAALLRKAEGTDNEHEADAYLQAAQRLATLSSVDLAVARAHTSQREQRVVPTQRTITIGESGKRGLRTYVLLFVVIGQANNLTCDVARDSTRVYAYGFGSDIDLTEALYASLVVQMVRASDAYIKSGDHSRELVLRQVETADRRGRRATRTVARPVHATTARISFQEAFAARIGRRLMEAKQESERAAVAASRPGTGAASAGAAETGVALVLRAREVELAEHYATQSQARGRWGGVSSSVPRAGRAQRAGDQAGRRARLGAEREIGGQRPAVARGRTGGG
ncbi:DUF2786 domain-containing protein [Nakamurella flava]|uniref:DUF2786 domain-containing protein n=1 Tax=Nakamurella flava TaxID=2576308 RepID=A0A4U6QAG1_9ACTN|nr:DUF2786 domain-containing protein [Nakamurella flava]TKV56923.1 DUF2786 domain-containing protein [Nakamurella flava]